MNYSVKQKTPLKWGSDWMDMGILGLSGEKRGNPYFNLYIRTKIL
jgi:hypothetical protein